MRRKAATRAAGLAIAATLGVTPLAPHIARAAPRATATPKGPEAAAKLKAAGDEYRTAGNVDAALREYARALEADPAHVPTLQEYGRTLYVKGDFTKAAAQFRKVAEVAPEDAVAWYNLGYALRKQGDYPGATQAYLSYIQKNPNDPDGYYSLAECYRARGMRSDAVEQYDLYAQKETRPSEQAWVTKAKARSEELRTTMPAVASATPAPAAAPTVVEVAAVAPAPAPTATVQVAAIAAPPAAPTPAPVAVAVAPAPAPVAPAPVAIAPAAPAPVAVAPAAPAPTPIATIGTPAAPPAAAAPAASALPTRDPTAAMLKIREGDELFKQKRYKEALFGYQDAVRLDDQSVGGYLKMGLAYANMNFYKEAVENWEKVLKLDPGNKYAPGYIERAKPFLGAAAPAPVSDAPKPVTADAPLNTPAPAATTAAAPAANVSPEAVAESKEEYRKAVALINAGRFAESLPPLNLAIEKNPGFVNAFVARAGAYLGMRSYNESVADYLKALAMNPQLATPLYGLGRAYEKLGDKAKAVEFYRKYASSAAPDANAALKRQADQAADNLMR